MGKHAAKAAAAPARPNRRGRKSDAELLDNFAAKKRFLAKLPKIGPNSTEPDVMKWVQLVTAAFLSGLLSTTEMEALKDVASIQLRALKQHHGRHDIVYLEELVKRAEAVEARAAARGAKLRDRTH